MILVRHGYLEPGEKVELVLWIGYTYQGLPWRTGGMVLRAWIRIQVLGNDLRGRLNNGGK
jgi:hypothetical protein